MWLSTTHCKPDLSFSKLTPPLFPSSRFSRTWLPSNAKQLNFAMVPHRATYEYMWSTHMCVHKVFPHPRSRCLPPMVSWRCSKGRCSAPLRKSSRSRPGHLGHGRKRLPPLRAHINPWPAPHLMVPDHRCNQLQQWAPQRGLDKVRSGPQLNAHLSFAICTVRPPPSRPHRAGHFPCPV